MKIHLKTALNNSRIQAILFLSGVCVVLVGTLSFGNILQTDTAFEAHAAEVIAACAEMSYKPTCYDEQIPQLLNAMPLADVFSVVRIVQQRDNSYGYCHVLGHELGEREVAKDPSRWMDVVTKCPSDGMCANGCLHGALIERFSGGEAGLTQEQIEAAKPDLSVACERRDDWDPTQLDQAICYHGLGHLSVYITLADLEHSLAICDDIARKEGGRDFTDLCYGGVFMQLFQPLEPEDEALVADITVTQENFTQFCNSFGTEEKRRACFVQGWPVFEQEVRTPDGLISFCNQSENAQTQSACLKGLFHTIGQGANFEVDTIREMCAGIPDAFRGECYGDAARSMIQADPRFTTRAARLCDSVETESARSKCFDAIVEYADYRFHTDSNDFATLCDALPVPWRDSCLAKQR